MAGFDPSLDNELWAENAQVAENMNIKVSVMSYNEGMPKVQISRERTTKDGKPSFAKLGRMTKDEIDIVLPLIQKSKEWMDENLTEEK
ncbi:hypothetical protein HQ545_00385 [Candidatus Woesearchaeota archaeon]|nr:hypothetical protein [Candidatus Woesearchaeota archaeon]